MGTRGGVGVSKDRQGALMEEIARIARIANITEIERQRLTADQL